MSLQRLEPGTFVELTDVLTGGRKIALVDSTGLGYFDVWGGEELPRPLRVELKLTPLGSIQSWLKALPPEQTAAFASAWQELLKSTNDVLFIARALRWGITQGALDLELMQQAAKAEADTLLAGRKMLSSPHA